MKNAPMLYEILSFAQRKDQVKCYTPRGSGCMFVPEAIFFRIICHFKKSFYKKLRSGSGVWGIKEKSRGLECYRMARLQTKIWENHDLCRIGIGRIQ